MNNYLFLDVDGVLNTVDDIGLYALNPKNLRILQLLQHATQAKIILSSDWRFGGKQVLIDKLAEFNLDIFDVTLDYSSANVRQSSPNIIREIEISQYIRHNMGEGKFAILDDLKLNLANFFWCDPKYGLTREIANKIISHFSKD